MIIILTKKKNHFSVDNLVGELKDKEEVPEFDNITNFCKKESMFLVL